MNPLTINMKKLLSVSVSLAGAACEIVKGFYSQAEQTKTYMKGVNDYVTEADFKIQTVLIKGLRHHFPEIKIVGEEDKEYDGLIEIDYTKLEIPTIPNTFDSYKDEYSSQDLCVWIDPIDNTKGFVQGQIQDVTILIGISHKKYAQMGVIGVPYKRINGQAVYDPIIVFGSVNAKSTFEYLVKKQEFIPLVSQPPKKIPTILTSSSRVTQIQDILVQKFKAEKVRVGGSGRKIDLVLRQGHTLACYPFEQTSKWDSCAGDAIALAMNGFFTDCYGNQLEYNPQNPKQKNINGYLCSFDQDIFKKSIETCKQFRKSSL